MEELKREIKGLAPKAPVKRDPGHVKAEFFEDGTDEEYVEHVKMEEDGWKGFINKVKNL